MLIWFNSIVSVLIVSLVSVIGILFLALKKEKLEEIQLLLVALATGGLLGGAFFHLLPESFESFSNVRYASFLLVIGFLLFFILERFLHWQHNHTSGISDHAIKPFGTINLFADGFHNFLDGILIAASYTHSFETGLATTLVVLLHEIPQEIGDFGVLIHAGFSRKKAIVFNFISASVAFLGALTVLIFEPLAQVLSKAVLPLAAGGFIYLAAADLIPELHNEKTLHKSIYQFAALIAGMGLLILLAVYTE